MRIYNWVKNVLFDGQNTGKTFNERRTDNKYLQELKRKFESAYNTAYNAESKTSYHISANLSSDIDNVLNNINERNPVRLRDYTPSILVQNGIKDLPMYENPSHIRKNILTDSEAINLGIQVNEKEHYHGLGKDIYMQAIDSLDDPRVVLKYKNVPNQYVILTVVKDNQNNNIIVPIEVETSTYANNIKIDINRVKSVYGYDRTNPDMNKYIKDSIKNNNLEKIYEKKKSSTGKTPQSTSKYSIPSSDSTVNNKYMQNSEKNSQGLENSSSFSMSKDNQGRTLSKEQQEYFKDSKIRDENGNLLTVYHGTPNGTFTVFNGGSYFTSRKDYAKVYQNTSASSISTKQESSNPKVYEVYLNIKNPFTIQDIKAKEIYLNEFIKGGNSLSYDPYTNWEKEINRLNEIDWTEAEDLKEWLEENHPEYDGLILDEGGDGGYGEEYSWRGKSFVPFNPNQIKSVDDNTNPTSNLDIRYSQSNNEWSKYLKENWDLMPNSKKTYAFPTNEQLQATDNKKISEDVNALN